MLAKLLKNDLIQTGRLFLWLLVGGVAGGVVGLVITLKEGIGFGPALAATLWNFLLIVASIVLEVLGLVIILVGTNRAMFTERGYLTMALPVSSTQLLFSKFASNVLLMTAVTAEVGGLWVLAASNIFRLAKNVTDTVSADLGFADMRETLAEAGFGNMFPSLEATLKYLSFMLMRVLVFMILAMMIALFVLTISHVRPFQAAPGVCIPVFLLLVSVAFVLLNNLITKYAKLNVKLNFGGMLQGQSLTTNLVGIFVMLGVSVALFAVTDYLLSRKISLK